jgi:hypothetical protein
MQDKAESLTDVLIRIMETEGDREVLERSWRIECLDAYIISQTLQSHETHLVDFLPEATIGVGIIVSGTRLFERSPFVTIPEDVHISRLIQHSHDIDLEIIAENGPPWIVHHK